MWISKMASTWMSGFNWGVGSSGWSVCRGRRKKIFNIANAGSIECHKIFILKSYVSCFMLLMLCLILIIYSSREWLEELFTFSVSKQWCGINLFVNSQLVSTGLCPEVSRLINIIFKPQLEFYVSFRFRHVKRQFFTSPLNSWFIAWPSDNKLKLE